MAFSVFAVRWVEETGEFRPRAAPNPRCQPSRCVPRRRLGGALL